MSQLNQNRYDQLLRRVGDLKGPGSKVNDALTELFPMIDVENVPAELLVLSGTRLAMGTIFLGAGGAGFFSKAMLRNPGQSGALIRVLVVNARLSVAGNILLGPSQNTFGTAGTQAFADGRVFGEGTVGRVLGLNNDLVAGSTFFRIRDQVIEGVNWQPPVAPMVISPGTALEVSAGSDNVAIAVSFLWVERVAQPSELNL